MSAGSLAPTIPSTIPLRVLCCRYRLPLVPGGWFVQLCQGIGGYTEIRGTCAQEHVVTRAARLRVSCSRCLARFSGRISRSAWDSSPREGGVSCTRGATDRPVGPILPSVAQTSVCDVGKIGCGPAAGTGNVRSLEAVSFELAEGIWRWRGMLESGRINGNSVYGPLSPSSCASFAWQGLVRVSLVRFVLRVKTRAATLGRTAGGVARRLVTAKNVPSRASFDEPGGSFAGLPFGVADRSASGAFRR